MGVEPGVIASEGSWNGRKRRETPASLGTAVIANGATEERSAAIPSVKRYRLSEGTAAVAKAPSQ